jgi:hypothetical protein
MPISQYRMIALINAASDYQQALATACHTAEMYFNLAKTGKMSYGEALTMCQGIIKEIGLLSYPIESARIISTEKTHFSREAKRNDRAAARKRAQALKPPSRRQKTGMEVQFIQHSPPVTTAPHSLARGSEVLGSPYQQALEPDKEPTPGHPLSAVKPTWVNPYDSLEEDEIDFETLIQGQGMSPETKAQIDAQVAIESREEEPNGQPGQSEDGAGR